MVLLKLIHWIVIFEQLGPEVYFPGGREIVDPPSPGNLGAKFSETSFPQFKTYLCKLAEVIFRQQFKMFGSNNFTLSLMFSFQNAWPT